MFSLGAQNTSAGVFGRLPQASKVAKRGPAPFSGLRIRRRAFLAACRRLQKSPNAALHRFRGSEYVGGRFWPLAAGFKSRQTRPCTVFGAQNTSAGVFGRLPQASKVAKRGPAPFSGLRIRRRAFLAACRRLQKSPNAALHRFRGSEYVGGRFWPLAAGFKSRQTRPCTVFGAQNTSAGVFGRLPQASKVAKRGPAPFSGLRIRRRAFLAACRRLQKSPNAALHRFRGSEYVGGRFWPLAAGFKSRQTRPCTVFGAQNTSAGVFGRLPQASKVAKRGPAPFSGLRIRRRAFLAACRRLQKSPNAALHRFRGSEYVGGRFWPLAAGFKSRQTRPCTVFGAQNTSAGVFGRLPQASKVAKRGPAPFSGLRIRRRAFLAACRRLQKSPNAALHRFRGSEYVGGRFWPLAAGFKSRQTRPCTVFGAQNTSAGVFGRLPQASKVAKRGPAPFSGLRIRRRAFLAACRRLQKSPNAALHRFRGSEYVGGRFWPLAAGFKSRQTRPCTVFGAQNTSAGVFGRLPQASKVAKRGPAPFSGLRIRRRAFLAACRRLQKSPNAALHRFRGSEYVGGRFWPLAAGFKSRQTRPCTVFGAQNTSAGVFGRLPQASKVAKRGPAPFSGLRIRRRAFLAACRRLQKSPNAALHRFRGSEYVGGRFWPLAAGFKSRQTRPCTVFGAQNTSAGVFGRLPQASKVAKRGPAPFSGLRIRRRAFLAACRRLQKSPNAALHRFRGSEYVGGRFWPLAAGFKSRQTRPCTVFGAQNTSAGVFGRLPQASKVAKRGPAPFSGLRIRRRAFLAACRRLQKSPNAALHRFRGSEYVGGRFWPLAAGFKSRQTRPCTVFGAQNTSAGVFGRLPQASKVAKRGPAPFSGLRIRRRAFLAACRRLQKSPNAALHRFRGSEYVGGRFWPLAAGFKSRQTRPCTVFGAQNTSAGVFGRLPQASKVAKRGPAPFSGLRIRRRAFLAACRRLQKSPNAALHRFRGSEYVGGRFWPLAAGFKSRQTRPCTVFGAQNTSAGVFGRLPQASKVAKRGPAPFSGLRIRRRAFLAACRRLQKSPNAALHRFRGSEYVGGRFWPLAAGFKSRQTRPCTVFGAQNTSAGVFGRLPQASKVAKRGPAPFSGLRIRRRAFLAACRRLQKSPNAALHRFRGSEYVGGRFWPLAAGFKSRQTRPCTVFGAQNTSAGVFGRLPQASKVAKRGPAPFSGLRIRRRAFLAACRRLQKSPNAALHRFRGSEYVGGRFWPLAAGFKSRQTRPCTVFGAQNTSAGVFGRLPQASKVAKRGPAPFSGLRIRRRAFLAACRRLQKSPNAALHRFRGSEYVGGRFWPLAAGFKSRQTRPCTVFGAQNTSAGVFGRLPQASKVAKRGPAPFSGLRIRRRAFLAACRRLQKSPNAALHRFRGSEYVGGRFWPLAAGFKSRQTRPCTVFGAQNTSAGVFGRLPQASKVAKRGPAPFSGLRIRRRAFLAACRRLQKSPNAALHRFRGSEYVGGRFWPLAAGFKSRQTRPCTVFGAQNTSAGVFGRLPQASKVAKRGPAPFSGLRIRRRAFLAACRRLQKSPNAALHRFRGSEYVGGRFWPLAAGFKSRQTRPCTVFGAQNTAAGVFGRLPQASKVAKRGPAPFSGLRIRRRAFLAACRRLQKSPNAALHRFRGSEYVGGRFWPLAAGFKSRQTRPCTVFGAQNTSAGVFGRLPQASKVAKRGPAPFSGLRIRRRAFLAACRRLQKSPNAALHRFRGSEYVGGRFWPLAAGFKSRQTRPCTVFGAQNTSAGVFGRLPQASKVAKRGPAPFSGLRIRRRAFLAACRRLQKSPNAALHRFRGSEYVGGRFWPLAAGFKSRQTRPCTVFGAQNTSAGVFGRLPQASKVAKRGPAPFSGLRIRRRAFLAACRSDSK